MHTVTAAAIHATHHTAHLWIEADDEDRAKRLYQRLAPPGLQGHGVHPLAAENRAGILNPPSRQSINGQEGDAIGDVTLRVAMTHTARLGPVAAAAACDRRTSTNLVGSTSPTPSARVTSRLAAADLAAGSLTSGARRLLSTRQR